MSAYTALEATSETLQELLQSRFDVNDALKFVTVLLKTPKKEMGSEKRSRSGCIEWCETSSG
jgi:hypothetical protein